MAGWRTGLVTGGMSDTLPSPSPAVRLLIYGQSQKSEKYPGVIFLAGGSAVHMCRGLSQPHGTPFISHRRHADNILLYIMHTSQAALAHSRSREPGGGQLPIKWSHINTQPVFRWHSVSGILFLRSFCEFVICGCLTGSYWGVYKAWFPSCSDSTIIWLCFNSAAAPSVRPPFFSPIFFPYASLQSILISSFTM